MGLDRQGDAHPEGRITRSPMEIARVLEALIARRVPINSHLRGGELVFVSHLRYADPAGQYVIVDFGPNEEANLELMARPRCAFFTEPSGWHVEFVLPAPQKTLHEGTAAIRFEYPELLANIQTRTHARAPGSLTVRLHCIADEGGIMPFEAWIVDVSVAGIGFLTYDSAITLEPGTVLKDCRLETQGMASVIVDLEVRYSELVTLPDGTQAKRSGCRFIDPPEAIRDMISGLSG
jgi:flagellar brake protein